MDFRLMAAACAAMIVGGASAQDAVQWRVEDGGNGHWYGLDPTALAWTAAQEAAVARGGHLATTTSQAEHEFIQLLKPAGWHWLGGRLACIDGLPPSDDNCEWIWVTGEAFEFSAWSGGEPNYVFATERTATNGGAWFDMCSPCDVQNFTPPSIIEWSADCNNDGVVDYGQILTGQLADTNANGVPDACEIGPCPGDVTDNGVVNGTDLAAILAAWGSDGSSKFDCDIDNDGVVGGGDLAFVLAGWGACP